MGNLPNGGDGNDALNTRMASLIRCLPRIYVERIPLRYWIPWWWQYIPIWAYFPQEIIPDIAKVYARVIPPGWEPPEGETDEEGTKLVGDVGVEVIELTDREGNGNYTGVLQTQFKDMGEYKINILAWGKEGGFAKVESTYVTRNEEGTKPPDDTPPTIAITNPSSNAVVKGTINITAIGDDDQALDKIQIFLDDKLIKEETMPSYYPYPEVIESVNTWDLENGKHTITAKAIDNAGNSNNVSIIVTADNQLTIPTPGFTTLIIGCSLMAMTIYIFSRRRFNKR
ncbi:MAG: Ig-like domain-containing protein [Promethearchaeota archaeon]